MRKISAWIAPVVAATAIMAFALGGVAQASKHVAASPVKGALTNVRPLNATTGKLLKNNIVANAYSGSAAPAGFVNVDSAHSIVCPATKAPCVIEMVAMVQFDASSATGPNALCELVDGSAYSTCPYLDAGPATGFYKTATATGYVSVAAGTHTVQTQIYTASGTTIYNYDIAYHEYG